MDVFNLHSNLCSRYYYSPLTNQGTEAQFGDEHLREKERVAGSHEAPETENG